MLEMCFLKQAPSPVSTCQWFEGAALGIGRDAESTKGRGRFGDASTRTSDLLSNHRNRVAGTRPQPHHDLNGHVLEFARRRVTELVDRMSPNGRFAIGELAHEMRRNLPY